MAAYTTAYKNSTSVRAPGPSGEREALGFGRLGYLRAVAGGPKAPVQKKNSRWGANFFFREKGGAGPPIYVIQINLAEALCPVIFSKLFPSKLLSSA